MNIKNRSLLGEVMGKSRVSCSSTHGGSEPEIMTLGPGSSSYGILGNRQQIFLRGDVLFLYCFIGLFSRRSFQVKPNRVPQRYVVDC